MTLAQTAGGRFFANDAGKAPRAFASTRGIRDAPSVRPITFFKPLIKICFKSNDGDFV